jgi:hypothetical protein
MCVTMEGASRTPLIPVARQDHDPDKYPAVATGILPRASLAYVMSDASACAVPVCGLRGERYSLMETSKVISAVAPKLTE